MERLETIITVDTVINLAVCPHGLTDMWEYTPLALLTAYGGAALVVSVLDDKTILGVFLVVSTYHLGAIVVPITVAAIRSIAAAKTIVLFYMLITHLPAHYAEVDVTNTSAAILIAFGVALEAAHFRPLDWPRVTTALVTGHAVVGLMPW